MRGFSDKINIPINRNTVLSKEKNDKFISNGIQMG